MSNSELALWMFLQLALILCVVRAVGFLAQYVKQPRVVGEMIAGVLIGPSVLGHYAPSLQSWLFPKQTLPILYALSQIGLVLYMFLVGMEFNRKQFRSLARGALLVSITGILVPFTMGALFVASVFQYGGLFTESVSLPQAALFIGAAMSITAFPMLARIIKEQNLSGSALGVLALAAGAADDAAAWCILAVVLSIFKNDYSIAISALVGGIAYAGVVAGILLPMFSKYETTIALRLRSKGSLLGSTMALLCLGAWFTDYVGIYAVFGAFILGIAIPRQHIGKELSRDIEPLASTFLLPLFFVYSGLNTNIALLVNPTVLAYTAIVIALACIGKGVACALASKFSGLSTQESIMLGALMNARGLMELILLTIGLERGLITPTLFTMMVMMAIATTLLTSPIFLALRRSLKWSLPGEESREKSFVDDSLDQRRASGA